MRSGAATLLLLGTVACATVHHADPNVLRPMPAAAGTGISGLRVIVLPVSAIRGGDTRGWAASIADPRAFLVDLNAQIARALPARAARTVWLLPAELERVADRNAGYAPDAYRLDPTQFSPDRWHAGQKLLDPLASDLRILTAFVDSRVALVPAEVRFFPRPPRPGTHAGTDTASTDGQAVLRVALVDTRSMAVFWVGDVVGRPTGALTPAVSADLANHLADALATQ